MENHQGAGRDGRGEDGVRKRKGDGVGGEQKQAAVENDEEEGEDTASGDVDRIEEADLRPADGPSFLAESQEGEGGSRRRAKVGGIRCTGRRRAEGKREETLLYDWLREQSFL